MLPERTTYDDKLDSILAAAAVVFAEKGYHNASIRDIARATGTSLSGLYYYFQSKEELLYLVQEHSLSRLIRGVEERLVGVEDPEQKLRLLIENQLTFFVDRMAEMKVLSHEAGSLKGEYRKRVNDQKRRLTAIASDILHELSPESEYDPRVATFALFGMMNWLYNWYRSDRDAPLEKLISDMTRIFLSGFLAGRPPVQVDAVAVTPAVPG
jgi:AcrR family transcriptional regulator